MATTTLLAPYLTLLLPMNACQMILFHLLRPLLLYYSHTYSAASPECLKNDPMLFLMATATLHSPLLTLLLPLLPLNALKLIQLLSPMATATPLTALLTLLLPLNDLKMTQLLLLWPLLLYLRRY
jgi:hypothetical protein